MEVNAKVIKVLEPTKYTSRRDGSEQYIYGFVVETINEQYPKKIYMQVFGADRWAQFNIKEGNKYNLRFDVGSREYNGHWFTEVTCFSAYAINANAPQSNSSTQPKPQRAPKQQAVPQAAPQPSAPAPASDNEDDLPF